MNNTDRKSIRMGALLAEITDDLSEYTTKHKRAGRLYEWWSVEKERLASRYGEANVWLSKRRRRRWHAPGMNIVWMLLALTFFGLQLLQWLFR